MKDNHDLNNSLRYDIGETNLTVVSRDFLETLFTALTNRQRPRLSAITEKNLQFSASQSF